MGMSIGELLRELQDTSKIMGLEMVEIEYDPDSPHGRYLADSSANPDNYKISFGHVHSWRGVYAHPAIEPAAPDENSTVRELVKELNLGLTEEFQGWKGGEYRYREDQELWLSPEGSSEDYKFTSVEVRDGVVILHVKQEPY